MVYIDYLNADKIDELGTVWINGEEFKGIGYNGLLTVNTKTYVSEPTRANDGSMPNIGDHETFIVPRCKINFKYLNVNDYRRLCNAILPNEFLVKYYDKDLGDFIEHWMYCEPQEMRKIYNIGTAVIGVLDYEISFIGTLNNLKQLTVQYDTSGEDIKNGGNPYNSAETYELGDRVSYNNAYYEAIFYENTFNGIAVTNTVYWRSVTINAWKQHAEYLTGNLVYVTKTSSGATTYTYYKCVKHHQAVDASTLNADYWEEIKIKTFDYSATYTKGDYVWSIGIADGSRLHYQAIYESNSFSNKLPTNSTYWKKIAISPITVDWGQSVLLPNPMDFFEDQTGRVANKWKVYRKNRYGEFVETTNYYSANQNVSVLQDMKLKPFWED